MKTFSALLTLSEGNSPVTGKFPSQRPLMQSFVVFFYLYLNKRLSKQSRRRWCDTPSRSLWRHCNDGYMSSPSRIFWPQQQDGYIVNKCRADSRLAPSQWETALLCNDASHWLGANLESALYMAPDGLRTQGARASSARRLTWHRILHYL